MIVFVDGPKHFLEPPDSKYEAMSLDELRDLSHLRMGDSRMTDKICKDAHARVLRFDYQQHNILYQKGLLRYKKSQGYSKSEFQNEIIDDMIT